MKQIIVHRPEIQRIPPFGTAVQSYFDMIIVGLSELGISHSVEEKKNKELRRDQSFNHIVYHTRQKAQNWLNAKMSYLNRFFYLDGEGYSGWSEIRNLRFEPDTIDRESADRYFLSLQRRFVEPQNTKYALPETNNVEGLPDQAILIFLQVFDDEVLKLSRASSQEMIEAAIRNRQGRPILIKRHPLCINAESLNLIEAELSKTPDCHLASGNIHSLLPKADLVLTINSGTGFEALLQEKQVLLFGRSDYHFATNSLDRGATHDSVFQEPRKPADLIKKFLFWYLNEQVFDIDKPQSAFTEQLEAKLKKKGWV